MSILMVPPTTDYPPGYTGDPYTPNDISKFFDMNWPDHAGMVAQGYSSPGLLSGMRGLGQDDSGVDLSSIDLSQLGGSSISTITDPSGSTVIPLPTSTSSVDLSSVFAGEGYTAANAPNTITLTPTQQSAFTSQLSAAQQAQLISSIGNSAVSLIRTASGGPYTIAGTNMVYNPATGQLTTQAATNALATLSGGLGSLTQYMPIILLAVAAIVILPMITGKK